MKGLLSNSQPALGYSIKHDTATCDRALGAVNRGFSGSSDPRGRLEAYEGGVQAAVGTSVCIFRRSCIFRRRTGGGRDVGARNPSHWHIGSPATARPLANEPFAPPKRRRRLVRKNSMSTFGGEAAQAWLDLAVPKRRAKARKRQAQPRPTLTPYERQPARRTSGRGARARTQP